MANGLQPTQMSQLNASRLSVGRVTISPLNDSSTPSPTPLSPLPASTPMIKQVSLRFPSSSDLRASSSTACSAADDREGESQDSPRNGAFTKPPLLRSATMIAKAKCYDLVTDGRVWVTMVSSMVNLAVVILLAVVVNPYKSELSQVQQQMIDLQSNVLLINAIQQLANYSQIQGAASVIQNQVQSVNSQASVLDYELSQAITNFANINKTVSKLNQAVFANENLVFNGSTGSCQNKPGTSFGPYDQNSGASNQGSPLISPQPGGRYSLLNIAVISVMNPYVILSGLCNITAAPRSSPPYFLSLWDETQGVLFTQEFKSNVWGIQSFNMNGTAPGFWHFNTTSTIWLSCLDNCLIMECAPLCVKMSY